MGPYPVEEESFPPSSASPLTVAQSVPRPPSAPVAKVGSSDIRRLPQQKLCPQVFALCCSRLGAASFSRPLEFSLFYLLRQR